MTENRRKRNKAGIIWLFLMLIWLMVIFSFSAKKADESTVMSHSVGKLIGNIVIPEYRSWPEDKQEQFAEKIDFPVRKCVHASEYAVLGCVDAGDCVLFFGRAGEKEQIIMLVCRYGIRSNR